MFGYICNINVFWCFNINRILWVKEILKMTVKELIEELKQYPEQTNIYFFDSEWGLEEIEIDNNYYDFDGYKRLIIRGD